MTSLSRVNSSPPSRDESKKIVKSSSRCFICSSASLKNNKIFIFGKSSLGFAEVIRSSLSVDVSRYSENSELFVCIDKCYQRLIKFNQVSDKLKELKKTNRRSLQGKRNMVFDLFLYSVIVQAKNYIQLRMPTEVSKIHQLHHLEEKHPNAICRYHLYFFCHPRRFGCVGNTNFC